MYFIIWNSVFFTLFFYKNIKSYEYRLTKYKQIAPFNGSIVEAYSDQGAIVNPGGPIIQVMRNDELEIEIPVPVKHMQNIKIGSKVSLYENEVVQVYDNNTKPGHLRAKDSMGRVWFIPKNYLKKIWCFLRFHYIYYWKN